MWDQFLQSYEFVWWERGEPWVMVGRIRIYLDVWEGVISGRLLVYVGCMRYLNGWEWEGMWCVCGSKRDGSGMEGGVGVALKGRRGRWFDLLVVVKCSGFPYNFARTLLCGSGSPLRPILTWWLSAQETCVDEHYKLMSDKIYIIRDVEHTITLFTRTIMFHFITQKLLFSIVLLKPATPLSMKVLNSLKCIIYYYLLLFCLDQQLPSEGRNLTL